MKKQVFLLIANNKWDEALYEILLESLEADKNTGRVEVSPELVSRFEAEEAEINRLRAMTSEEKELAAAAWNSALEQEFPNVALDKEKIEDFIEHVEMISDMLVDSGDEFSLFAIEDIYDSSLISLTDGSKLMALNGEAWAKTQLKAAEERLERVTFELRREKEKVKQYNKLLALMRKRIHENNIGNS